MNYRVEIQEILSRTVDVEADSIDEAYKKARQAYRAEEIVLSADDYVGTDFVVSDIDNKQDVIVK